MKTFSSIQNDAIIYLLAIFAWGATAVWVFNLINVDDELRSLATFFGFFALASIISAFLSGILAKFLMRLISNRLLHGVFGLALFIVAATTALLLSGFAIDEIFDSWVPESFIYAIPVYCVIMSTLFRISCEWGLWRSFWFSFVISIAHFCAFVIAFDLVWSSYFSDIPLLGRLSDRNNDYFSLETFVPGAIFGSLSILGMAFVDRTFRRLAGILSAILITGLVAGFGIVTPSNIFDEFLAGDSYYLFYAIVFTLFGVIITSLAATYRPNVGSELSS